MGWGKGKGKAVAHALHHAERQEEHAAERALAHGDIVGAVVHAQKAEALEHAEHAAHWKGKGKGKHKGYGEVVVVPSAPVVVEVHAVPYTAPVVVEAPALVVVAAVAVPGPKGHGKHHEPVLAKARHEHHVEAREEHLAHRDLAHGNILGAIAHEVKAVHAHQKAERLDSEIRHEHWDREARWEQHEHWDHHKGKGKGHGKKGW
jgi:hypothetical protein